MSKFINNKLRVFFDDSMILVKRLLKKNMVNFRILVNLKHGIQTNLVNF